MAIDNLRLSADSGLAHVTGKGLELQPDNFPPSFPYREPGLVIETGEKKLEVNVATCYISVDTSKGMNAHYAVGES